jgi:3-deoxy-D-manno-octulosonic-acid transferase
MTIVEYLYSLLVLFLSPLLGFSFLFSKRGRVGIRQRFGFWKDLNGSQYLWIHAASRGEMNGVLPLIKSVRLLNPDQAILVTATSPSAFPVLEALNVEYRLLPFDHRIYLARALKQYSFSALVIAETEIWPGLLSLVFRRKIPVTMVNARISDYTIARYRVLAKLIPNIFTRLRAVLVADTISAQRFKELGVQVVQLTGNMKYDTKPSLESLTEQQAWRARFPFDNAPILVLGSIRPGEEDAWLEAIVRQRKKGAQFGCVLAPRHMEKIEFFIQKLSDAELSYWRFSERDSWPRDGIPDVVLLDSLGLLEKTYAIASLVFIGATLVDIGGHNPLEAAAYAVPIVIGPYDSTVREVTEQMILQQGVIRIQVGEDLESLIERLVCHDSELARIGSAAQAIWRTNRGATDAVLKFLEDQGMRAAVTSRHSEIG